MQWKQQALERFSHQKDAGKWAHIYAPTNLNIEAVNFRKRRDYSVEYVVEHMPAGSDILDLGCGAGPVLVELCQHNYNLIGIDYSEDMLLLARQQLGAAADKIPLMLGECEAIPLPDASVDCIVCLGVISYAESIEMALQDMYRVLRPGGTAIVSYRNAFNDIVMDPIALLKHLAQPVLALAQTPHKTIGRSIPRREVLDHLQRTRFSLNAEHQIGFGTLRFNRKVIVDGRLAIRFNRLVHNLLQGFALHKLYRAMADVHIMILKK